MLNYQQFVERVAESLQENLGLDYDVQIEKIVGNNGVTQIVVLVENLEANVSLYINLEDYYLRYQIGLLPFADALKDIETMCRSHAVTKDIDLSFITDYSSAKGKLRGKLINTELNRDYLGTVPHREFLDLSLVYMISVIGEGFRYSWDVPVKNEHLQKWGVTESQVFEAAMVNIKQDNTELLSMEEVLKEFLDKWDEAGYDDEDVVADFDREDVVADFDREDVAADFDREDVAVDFDDEESEADFEDEEDEAGLDDEEEPMLYVAGRKEHVYGAVELLNARFMRESADSLGGDFMILPSSVHELLFLPVPKIKLYPDELAQMVREVNATQVKDEEILSNHVYRYNREREEIVMVA